MIKEYKTQKSMQAGAGSVSFKSNASTKAFQNEEIQRLNKIMNEPIDNLIENMNVYSRPISSSKQPTNISVNNLGKNSKAGIPSIKKSKKERAMTAHAKSSHFYVIRNRR
jgi:hypothetical protein